MVKQCFCKAKIPGSSPGGGSNIFIKILSPRCYRHIMASRFCVYCDKELKERHKIKFCSNKCQREQEYQAFISLWKAGIKTGGIGVQVRSVSGYIRRYLLRKSGKRCSLCRWGKVHSITRKVPLEIDHIDGNSENNTEENLRLICPNCHSLTMHFKNLNKGKGRKWRMKKYIRNK